MKEDNCKFCSDVVNTNERSVEEVTYWVDPATHHRYELKTGVSAHLDCAQAVDKGSDPIAARGQMKLLP